MAEEKAPAQPIDPKVRALAGRYPQQYSERGFRQKLKRWATHAGRAVIQHVLLLYYCAKDADTPKAVRTLIWGALGYFIWPMDVVPDSTPGSGFLDDLAVCLLLIGQIAHYIKADHYQRTGERIKEWFAEGND